MHLASLNLPDLLIPLWCGIFDCDRTDSRTTWDWAVLQGDVWKVHGQAVANATPYLPGSFDRPPRNSAEKISSGYKAWEFLIYLFGLGPGLLYGVLPDKYWKNFCTLVCGIRLINQHKITSKDLQRAHKSLVQFCIGFEQLYYQRRVDRLHFVWPCVHSLIHLGTEVVRLSPPICSSQWTMERTIGNLGQEIRQPSNLFANLSQRGLRRAQVNALKSMIPDLEPLKDHLPRCAVDLGGGYVLLRARQRTAGPLHECEAVALWVYIHDMHALEVDSAAMATPLVRRWARLQLPNGQVARSAWNEKKKTLRNVRMARNLLLDDNLCFAEVLFYFQMPINDETKSLALISLYSQPHATLLEASSYMLWSLTSQGDTALRVVDVKAITAVVAMVPHNPFEEAGTRFFVVEKPGLDVAHMGGNDEVVVDNDNGILEEN
ncbi:hypothetical protein BKA93DRAFT_728601 [Sparassis latifolia]